MISNQYSYTTTDEGSLFIENTQEDISIDIRRLVNNMDLQNDPKFVKSLRTKSSRMIEYLITDATTIYEKDIDNKREIKENIIVIEEKIKKIQCPNTKLKRDKRINKLNKLSNKLIKLKHSLISEIHFGNTDIQIKLSTECLIDKDLQAERLENWRASRLRYIPIYGEANKHGNRFFDFKDLDKGLLIYKPKCGIKIPIQLVNYTRSKERWNYLIKLKEMSLNKEIPITIQLTKNNITICFDESKVCGTFKNIDGFYKSINHIKDKEEKKTLIAQFHREHERKLKIGKLNRYLSIDLNPDGIGYSIIDLCKNGKDIYFVRLGYIDISKIYDANKRQYDTSLMMKEIFTLIRQYRCHSIIVENLHFEDTDLGNKVSNRKVNNLWNRGLIEQIIKRRCAEDGLIYLPINPFNTSLMGNILYKQYDPVASAMMIGRRGIFQYNKENNKGNYIPAIDITYFLNDKMYEEMKECKTWLEIRLFFEMRGLSFRRDMSESKISSVKNLRDKSKTKHYTFLV